MNQSSILIFGLLCISKFIFIYSTSTNYNNLRLRNYGLRLIVFKEKKLNKILFEVKKIIENYHNKSIVITAQGINTFNELSEDDKLILETLISLYF
jgi:hypothetical protein